MAVVTFTTDFGHSDAYVGALKGVVLSLAADAVLVDLTHAIPPQDVREGAWALREAAGFFPSGSIHLAVVDPGVGGDRYGIAVASRGQYYVGPDNGLLSMAAAQPRRIFRTENPLFRREPVSPTFRGRDIFAVAAGRLAAGHPIEEAGPELDGMVELPFPATSPLGELCAAEVVHVDHFGNLVTSLLATEVEGCWEMECDGRSFRIAGGRTYADVDRGALVLYPGSSGLVEVAVRDGSAALLVQAKAGARLRLKRLS
jgi:S-adenosylmethionine hydrolase